MVPLLKLSKPCTGMRTLHVGLPSNQHHFNMLWESGMNTTLNLAVTHNHQN